MSSWTPGRWPESSRPITVEGGVTARSKRGAIGEQWWSRRFIDVLESFGMQSRLTRGRNYARSGQVLSLDIGTGPAVFILSLKAGGTGLNLTAANHVVHVDRWWNPAVEDQATDRAFRIGQRRDVQVRKFVCVGTLEERIDAMIEQKKALAEQIVGTGEGWLTELSTAALREVLTLSPEAVSA